MLQWLEAVWVLLSGILRRVYFWVLPFVFLQPIDLFQKFGIQLVIPDQVVYGLVGLGVFASAVDVVREHRAKLSEYEQESDARQVAGNVFVEPIMSAHPDRDKPTMAMLHPQIRVHNRSQRAITHRVLALSCTVNGERLPSMDEDELPTTIPPTDHMDTSGFISGPYAVGTDLEVLLDFQFEYGFPWAPPAVVEQKVFTFLATITAPDKYLASDWSLEKETRRFPRRGRRAPA
jgi:hypothetical protein